MKYVIVPLDTTHPRRSFNCGVPALNHYLHERAGQDIRKYYAALFVALDVSADKILGYYTLSNTSINLTDIPEFLRKTLPKYPEIPAIRLGRLAVDKSVQHQGLGTKLLADAMLRSMSNVSAWAMMVVDAKEETVCAFYKKCGFSELIDDNTRLYIARKTLDVFLRGRAGWENG
jgi:ribosomal protein S18 acetylase RimI-like enzyme